MDYCEQFRRAAIEQGIPEDEVGRFVVPERGLVAVVHAEMPHWLNNPADGEGKNGLSEFQQQLVRDMPHRRELCALVDASHAADPHLRKVVARANVA